MEQLLSTIIIIAIAFYLLRLLARLLGPWLLRRFFKNLSRRAGFDFKDTDTEHFDDGNVTIEYTRKQKERRQRPSDELGGEYVDYEEIK